MRLFCIVKDAYVSNESAVKYNLPSIIPDIITKLLNHDSEVTIALLS